MNRLRWERSSNVTYISQLECEGNKGAYNHTMCIAGQMNTMCIAGQILAIEVRTGGIKECSLSEHLTMERAVRGLQLFICGKVVVREKIVHHPQV